MSELREKAIRERLSKITPGPWKAHAYNSGMGTLVSWGDISKGQNIAIAFAQADHAQGASNGQFLAAARDDVPYLLAELKSAEQQRDQARELLRQSEAQLYRLQALTRSPQSFDMEIVNTDAEWLQRRIRKFLAPPAAKEETGK